MGGANNIEEGIIRQGVRFGGAGAREGTVGPGAASPGEPAT